MVQSTWLQQVCFVLWDHHCSVLCSCSFCGQAEPLMNTWNWNARTVHGHLGYCSGPSILLCSVCFKWYPDLLFCECFEKEDGRKACHCLIHYSRYGWIFLLLRRACKNWVKGLCFWRGAGSIRRQWILSLLLIFLNTTYYFVDVLSVLTRSWMQLWSCWMVIWDT